MKKRRKITPMMQFMNDINIQIQPGKEKAIIENVDDNSANKHTSDEARGKQTSLTTPASFPLLSFINYNHLPKYKFTLVELKAISKIHNISLNGKKDIVLNRLYNHMRQTYFAIKIQSTQRMRLITTYNKVRGNHNAKSQKLVNGEDCFSLDEIAAVPWNRIIYMTEPDGFVYWYDLATITTLFRKGKSYRTNPFTRRMYTTLEVNNWKHSVRIYKIITGNALESWGKREKNVDPHTQMVEYCRSLFIHIDSMGNYTNPDWFLNLEFNQLQKFLLELKRIWNWRADLSSSMKLEICPNGNPFLITNYDISSDASETFTLLKLQNIGLVIINELVSTSQVESSAVLGSMYVMTALTIVSHDARLAQPWLYSASA
jgi:hypothetical protein